MIAKDSYTLLQNLFDIELLKFIQGATVKGNLQKSVKMDDCREKIEEFMESHPNSNFVIKNTENKNGRSTMSLNISNIENINDHSRSFIITISTSCETFKVERQLGYIDVDNRKVQLVIDFDKIRV